MESNENKNIPYGNGINIQLETHSKPDPETELAKIIQRIKLMSSILVENEEDWNNTCSNIIKQWLIEYHNLLLFIYYENGILTASLSVPVTHNMDMDMVYFFRQPNQSFLTKHFIQDVTFGKLTGAFDEVLFLLLEHIYVPTFLNLASMKSDAAHTQLCVCFQTFLNFMTELQSKIVGVSMLYVPSKNLDLRTVISSNDQYRIFELIVNQWISSIRLVLNELKLANSNESRNLIDECYFYKTLVDTLKAIQLQAESVDCSNIISGLYRFNSHMVDQLHNLLSDVQIQFDIAMNNYQYLFLLLEPCQELENSEILENMPAHLSKIIQTIKYIWLNSKYLNTKEGITGLFLRFSGQLIAYFRRKINVSAIIIDGQLMEGVQLAKQCIDNCNYYKILFENTLNDGNGDIGELEAIFGKIDEFIQRLGDLMELCECVMVYGKSDAEINNRFDETIETSVITGDFNTKFGQTHITLAKRFSQELDILKKSFNNMLNVSNKAWTITFAEFKRKMVVLDQAVIDLIENLFLTKPNSEDGIDILYLLYSYSFRARIQHCYFTKLALVWNLFQRDMLETNIQLRQDVDAHFFNLPKFANKSFTLKINDDRLTRIKAIFKEAEWLPECSASFTAAKDFETLSGNFLKNAKSSHTEWMNTIIADNVRATMKRPLIRRSDLQDYLECNIHWSIFQNCDEARAFESAGFDIPPSVSNVYVRYARIKIITTKIVKIVADYNKILRDLSASDRALFEPLLTEAKQQILPAIFKLSLEDDLIDIFIVECFQKIGQIRGIVNMYKAANVQIRKTCEEISNVIVFRAYSKPPGGTMDDFLQCVEENRTTAVINLRNCHEQIVQILSGILKKLKGHGDKLKEPIAFYVNKIDTVLAESFKSCSSHSLDLLYKIFHGSLGRGGASIFDVDVALENEQLVLNPTIDEMFHLIEYATNIAAEFVKKMNRISATLNIVSACPQSYFQIIREDTTYRDQTKKVLGEIEPLRLKISTFVEDWNLILNAWNDIRDEFALQFTDEDVSPCLIQTHFDSCDRQMQQISHKDTLTEAHFVTINSNVFRTSLINDMLAYKSDVLKQLKFRSRGKMINCYDSMANNTRTLSIKPNTTDELVSAIEFYVKFKDEAHKLQLQFPLIKGYYALLDNNVVVISVNTRKMLDDLDLQWKLYLEQFAIAEKLFEECRSKFQSGLLSEEALLRERVDRIKELIKQLPTSSSIQPLVALNSINEVVVDVQKVLEMYQRIFTEGQKIQYIPPRNPDLPVIQCELDLLGKVWGLADQWENLWTMYKSQSLSSTRRGEMTNAASALLEALNAVLEENNPDWDISNVTIARARLFKKTIPVLKDIQNPAFRNRHWTQVKGLVNTDFDERSESLNLEAMIDMNMPHFFFQIAQISKYASKELEIEQALMRIQDVFSKVCIDFQPLQPKELYCIGKNDDCITALEDNSAQIVAMKASRYADPFTVELIYWEKTIYYIQECIEEGLSVQETWLNIRNIFQNEEIRKQLASEALALSEITEEWKYAIREMRRGTNIIYQIYYKKPRDLMVRFTKLKLRLEEIQRTLEKYLDGKRKNFPRFYFLANNELVEVVGNANNPEIIQKYLNKLFQNLSKCELKTTISKMTREKKLEVRGMYASDGEFVKFTDVVNVTDSADNWLRCLEATMKKVLKDQLQLCLRSFRDKKSSEVDKWLELWPAQLCQMAAKLQWTVNCTKTFKICSLVGARNPIKKLFKKQCSILHHLSLLNRSSLETQLRLKVCSQITLQLHNRDVIENLYKSNCLDAANFVWVSQLRFYWDNAQNDCVIRQTNATHWYNYEYAGNSSRLVVTPLTDRCFITLTTALNLHLGGNPIGPSGTGKTETVKDLGKAMGIWVLVTNCTDGMDYKTMEMLLSGLAQCGIWGCFDEFSRINTEVLSVVAQQMQTVLTALAQKLKTFMFAGESVNLTPTVGLFITINTGSGQHMYDLSHQFKSMFRPISMTVPDTAIIAENLLVSEGFANSKPLANKVKTVFNLAKRTMTVQPHYDFGLRAMIFLLKYASLKRREAHIENEEGLVVLAIKDMMHTRLTPEDSILLDEIISDIFADVWAPVISYTELINCIKAELLTANLQDIPNSIAKVLNLYETMSTRHSVMIVGASGTAKSVTWTILQKSLQNYENNEVTVYPINPKSLSPSELYGEYRMSGDWSDGVISAIMREISNYQTTANKWILFDGPIDPIWIENMNTVMDDNRTLTLINRERIRLPPNASLLFETEDLSAASPATVSRCGIIFNDYNDLGWRPFVDSWLRINSNRRGGDLLNKLFNEIIDKLLIFKSNNCKEAIQTSELNQIQSMCHLYDCLTIDDREDLISDEEAETLAKLRFFFTLIWTVCGVVDEFSRTVIDNYVRGIDNIFLVKDTVYDYYVDANLRAFMPWQDLVTNFNFNKSTPFADIVIPTVDTIRYKFLIQTVLLNNRPVLITGPAGSGKTFVAKSCLSDQNDQKFITTIMNMSSVTTVRHVLEAIESRTEKCTKELIAATKNKNLICFMDDFNMPAKEAYGAQPPLELMRQWADYNFWYDRSKKTRMYLKKMLLMASMGPVGGCRNTISSRISGKFYQINMTYPSDTAIKGIFEIMLAGHLSDFVPEVKSLGKLITDATVYLYNSVARQLLPTLSNIHYIFNLRDISRVFEGLLRSHKGYHTSKQTMLRLWMHECYRVFSDRIECAEDYDWFSKKISEALGDCFDVTFQNVCPTRRLPIFADFMESEFYEDIKEEGDIAEVVKSQLKHYNSTPGLPPMKVTLFRDVIEHVARIVRIISQPGGHLLLIGLGGSGRRTLAKLAAFIQKFKVFEIEVSRAYGEAQFRNDLKTLFKLTGVNKTPTLFLFCDAQATQEFFFHYINNILSVVEIPSLFEPDELLDVEDSLKDAALKEGMTEPTKEDMYKFFLNRIRANLVLAICLSPIGDGFRKRIRQYPALINNCSIDWIKEWPEPALIDVAFAYLNSSNVNNDSPSTATTDDRDKKYKNGLARSFSAIHISVREESLIMLTELQRHNYVTCTNYTDVLSQFLSLLENERNKNNRNATRLRNGVHKIDETKEAVETMSENLKTNQVELTLFQEQCDEFLVQISQQTAEADVQTANVREQSKRVSVEEKECKRLADSAKRDLDKAMPALDAATLALNSLNKNDLSEVKSYAKPPIVVEKVMEAVMILQSHKPTWTEAKRQLSDPTFLDKLKTFDRDNISEKTLSKIARYTRDPALEPEKVGIISFACKSLCLWVRAIERYAKIYRVVAPKMALYKEAMESLQMKQDELAAAQAKLDELARHLEELTEEFNHKTETKNELIRQAGVLTEKLKRAHVLVGSLSGERTRWAEVVENLDIDFQFLPGNCLLSAAFLSYLGPFTSKHRETLLEQWREYLATRGISYSPEFNICRFLSDATTMREYQLQGLPSDDFSKENAIIIKQHSRWPLIIDPQGQAHNWITNLEKEHDLNVIDAHDANILSILEKAVSSGHPLLLQNVEEDLDTSINGILNRELVNEEGSLFIKLTETMVKYDANFRFYMTTKLSNPHYPPEMTSKITLVNFAIKEEGLQSQLLRTVVIQERPDLEEQKDNLVLEIADKKKVLKEFENNILRILNDDQISVLDDDDLFDILQVSKETSATTAVFLQRAETTEKEIDTAREVYRPCAKRASVLFFVLLDMCRVDPMYAFSLTAYADLFVQSIIKSTKSSNFEKRILILNDYHTYSFYANTCRSLFQRHKLLFSFYMCVRLLQTANNFVKEEYNFLLRGGVVSDRSRQIENPAPSWLTDKTWDNITELDKVSGFHGIAESVVKQLREWHKWYQLKEPESAPLVGDWEKTVSQFQKIIIVRCMRADRLSLCLRKFVADALGEEFVEPSMLTLKDVVNEATAKMPLLFVTSAGVDPLNDLMRLADELGIADKLRSLSLGRSQTESAEKLIAQGIQHGHWVYLANCQLSLHWLSKLEKIIENIDIDNASPSFRLWLSTLPCSDFPISVLQSCIKITSEPKQGIRENLKKIYNSVKREDIENTDTINKYNKLLFSLCFFHVVVLERKRFQKLGWNLSYHFNYSDLEISENLLHFYLNEYTNETPWDALKYLIADVNYGGHIIDEWDRRLLETYMNKFFAVDILIENRFSLSKSATYFVPADCSSASCIEYIDGLPPFDGPEIFGCDSNAGIASQTAETTLLLNTLMGIQESGASHATNTSRQMKQLTLHIQSKLPSLINYEYLLTLIGPQKTPIDVVLLQETQRYNKLLTLIKTDLGDLLNAVVGFEIISFKLESLCNYLLEGHVPPSWLTLYASNMELGSWLLDLIRRVEYFTVWANTVHAPTFFWLGAFSMPVSFLTAILQTHSRAHNCPMDQLSWKFDVIADESSLKGYAGFGVPINGLFLEGAGWDGENHCLCDQKPMELMKRMPAMFFEPTLERTKRSRQVYQCPAYYTPDRGASFVIAIDLRCGTEGEDVWIKRGAAVLLNLGN